MKIKDHLNLARRVIILSVHNVGKKKKKSQNKKLESGNRKDISPFRVRELDDFGVV